MPRPLRWRSSASISPITLSFSALTMRIPKCTGIFLRGRANSIASSSARGSARLPIAIRVHQVTEQDVGNPLVACLAHMHMVGHRQGRVGARHAIDAAGPTHRREPIPVSPAVIDGDAALDATDAGK